MTERHYSFSPAAEQGIELIADYTIGQWGKPQAKGYVAKLLTNVQILAQAPHIGSDASYLRPGYRLYLSGSHVIYYKRNDHGIDIIRVLHQQIDADRHL